MHSHKHRRLHAPSLFYTSTGEVKPHVTLDGWARHSAPGLSLDNHKLNNFCMYSLDTICTEGYYFTQRAIGHIQFLTQPWWQLILGVVREIISWLLSRVLAPTWLCLSPWAGVLCPPRPACLPICLPICLPTGFVFHLGLGCCVRLARLVSQFVSQFVSHLALVSGLVSQFVSCLSPWAGVLCPPRSACLPICLPAGSCLRSCLPICLPPGFVFHLGLGCCVRLAQLVSQLVSQFCLPTGFVFHLGLGCCVRLARLVSGFVSGFVSQFVSHLALSFTLGWGAVSASLGLSPNLCPSLCLDLFSVCFKLMV